MAVTAQLQQGAAAIHRRYRAERFIAYFQSCCNSYNAIEQLEKLCRDALAFPGVVGLTIATRPDCLADATLDLYGPALRRGRSQSHCRAPTWSVPKRVTHNAIRRELIPRLAWQGRLYTKPKFRTSLANMSNEGAVT